MHCCARYGLLALPPAIAALLLSLGADDETVSSTFLVSCFLAYLLVPSVVHDRNRRRDA